MQYIGFIIVVDDKKKRIVMCTLNSFLFCEKTSLSIDHDKQMMKRRLISEILCRSVMFLLRLEKMRIVRCSFTHRSLIRKKRQIVKEMNCRRLGK